MDFTDMLLQLLVGLRISVEIFVYTLLIALPLGFVFAFGRMSTNPICSNFFRFIISVIRGTPLMLQIFVVYYGPYYLCGISLRGYPPLAATVIAFGINYSAYFGEIYRGGILSIDIGQHEASKALGLSKVQSFFRIVLPQTMKRVLPAIGNEIITLVKDTSLAFTIAVTEMFTIAKQLSSAHTTMIPLVAAGIFYYVFNYFVAAVLERLERRFSYYN